MMRKILLAGVALLALGGVAQADPSFQPGNPHQPPVSPPPPPPPPAPTPDVDNSPPMVVDAAGKVVGFAQGSVQAMINVAAPGAVSFLVQSAQVRPQGFYVGSGSSSFPVSQAQLNYFYPTHDCSGPAYLDAQSLPPSGYFTDAVHITASLDPAAYSGTATLAYPQPPYQVMGIWSIWQANGVGPTGVFCRDFAAEGDSTPDEQYVGLASTHTLSFTPPFHVE